MLKWFNMLNQFRASCIAPTIIVLYLVSSLDYRNVKKYYFVPTQKFYLF